MVQTLKSLLFFVLALAGVGAFAQTIPTCTITTTPASGAGLVDVTVNWTTNNAVVCTASGNWSGLKQCGSGSQTFNDITQTRTFNLTVKAATGKFGLKWTKPVRNTDDTPTTISGFKLYKAATAAGVPGATPITLGPDVLSHEEFIAVGPHSAAVKATRTDSVDSELSNIITKTVVASQGTCSATVTVTSRPRAPVISQVIAWVQSLLRG